MATCKDCIHERVCEELCPKGLLPYHSSEYPAETFCTEFKNKADFVEVVRCKDCEYYAPLGDAYEYKGKKAMHCILRASCTGDNYYCADGMRKEKDNG